MASKERGIIFSGAMVRALLAGTKTQTRRVVNPKLYIEVDGGDEGVGHIEQSEGAFGEAAEEFARCPYGAPGDRLWVRETWQAWKCVSAESDEWDPITREARCGESWAEWIELRGKPDAIEYRATSESVGPWTPSLHMPRWASRITLEVTEVRVQRLQEISEEDAQAEGVEARGSGECDVCSDDSCPACLDGKEAYPGARGNRILYAELWDSINGDRAPWSANCWVWAVSFRRVTP